MSNISEQMMTHLYRMMNFLKPENIRPEIIQSYKNWAINQEGNFRESIKVMTSLKEILEENIDSIEAQKIQDTIDILEKIRMEPLLKLIVSL